MAAFVPLPNAISCRWSGYKIEPIQTWMGIFCGENINEVTILKRGRQGQKPIINPHTMAMITHLRVNAKGKINRS